MNKNMFKRNNKVITSVFLIVFMAWMLFISVHSKQEQLQNNKTVFGFFFEETDADKVIDKSNVLLYHSIPLQSSSYPEYPPEVWQ